MKTIHIRVILLLLLFGVVTASHSSGSASEDSEWAERMAVLMQERDTIPKREYLERALALSSDMYRKISDRTVQAKVILELLGPVLRELEPAVDDESRRYLDRTVWVEWQLLSVMLQEVANDDDFEELRKAYADVIIDYLRKIDNRILDNDKIPVVWVNVMPPLCFSSCMPGMAVEGLKTEEERQAYREAIEENSRNTGVLNEQSTLRDVMRLAKPRAEIWVERMFTIRGVDPVRRDYYYYVGELEKMSDGAEPSGEHRKRRIVRSIPEIEFRKAAR